MHGGQLAGKTLLNQLLIAVMPGWRAERALHITVVSRHLNWSY